MTDLPAPTIRPTRYQVSLLPEDDEEGHLFAITVEDRGRGLWAVVRLGCCLDNKGDWSYESIPSEREDDWLKTHRFPLEQALSLAEQAAPHVTVNGFTVADALAMHAARTVR